MDDLLRMISHDIRAPLRGIQGFAGALREDYAPQLDERGADYLRRVCAAALKLDHMIEGLVRFGRIHRTPLSWAGEDASATVIDIIKGLEHRERQYAVTTHITPGISWKTDRRIFRQLLEAVLDNAWKFSRSVPAPHIEVHLERTTTGKLRIRVRDNGVGFDAAHAQDRIFSLFQRFHPPGEFPGEGVGLALARRCAHRLGGTIAIESAPNAGTTVLIEIPRPHSP